MLLNSTLTKIQGLFKEKWNSRTFQDVQTLNKEHSSADQNTFGIYWSF